MSDIQKIENNTGNNSLNNYGVQIQNQHNYNIVLKDTIEDLRLLKIGKKYTFYKKYYLIRESIDNYFIQNHKSKIVLSIFVGYPYKPSHKKTYLLSYYDPNKKSEISEDGWGWEGKGEDVIIFDSPDTNKVLTEAKIYLFNLENSYQTTKEYWEEFNEKLDQDIEKDIPPF